MEQDRPEEIQHIQGGYEPEESARAPAGEEAPPEWEWSPMTKIGFIFAGVIVPISCFGLVGLGFSPFDAHWQSEKLSDYCRLLFSLESCLPFYPFILYPMTCISYMVFWPRQSARRFVVRFGVYTGVAISLQYIILIGLALDDDWLGVVFFAVGQLAVSIIMLGGIWSTRYIYYKYDKVDSDGSRPHFFLAYVLRPVGLLLVLFHLIPPVCSYFSTFYSTTWSLIAYSMMSWRLLRRNGREPWQFSLAQLFVFVTWLAAYCSAWRMSIMLMLAEYAKLPTTPPERCYVCTAAARGHRWFVGSQAVRTDTNNVSWLNDQTRYLKAAEITLAATCPRMHRLARAVYDRMGPPAARLLVHPLVADAAYLAMKPAEWAARAFFAAAMPEASRLARRFYRGP